MPYGVANPYGAVPSALKELRLSFTDILNNIIQGKEIERQTARDLATAELAKAKIGAETERFGIEMAGKEKALDLEGLREGRRFGLEEEKLKETSRQHLLDTLHKKEMLGVEREKVDIEKGKAAFEKEKWKEEEGLRAATELYWKNKAREAGFGADKASEEVKLLKESNEINTVGEFGRRLGMSNSAIEYLFGDLNLKMKARDFITERSARGGTVAKDPRLMNIGFQNDIADKLRAVNDALALKPNDPVLKQDKERLIKQFDKRSKDAELYDAIPESTRVAVHGKWASDMNIRETYGNDFAKYLAEYAKGEKAGKVNIDELRKETGDKSKLQSSHGKGAAPTKESVPYSELEAINRAFGIGEVPPTPKRETGFERALRLQGGVPVTGIEPSTERKKSKFTVEKRELR